MFKKRTKNGDDRLKKSRWKKFVATHLEIPEDIYLNIPKITIQGRNRMIIENHRGVIQYTLKSIRVNTPLGVIQVNGKNFELQNFGRDDVVVVGDIDSFEYLSERE